METQVRLQEKSRYGGSNTNQEQWRGMNEGRCKDVTVIIAHYSTRSYSVYSHALRDRLPLLIMVQPVLHLCEYSFG